MTKRKRTMASLSDEDFQCQLQDEVCSLLFALNNTSDDTADREIEGVVERLADTGTLGLVLSTIQCAGSACRYFFRCGRHPDGRLALVIPTGRFPPLLHILFPVIDATTTPICGSWHDLYVGADESMCSLECALHAEVSSAEMAPWDRLSFRNWQSAASVLPTVCGQPAERAAIDYLCTLRAYRSPGKWTRDMLVSRADPNRTIREWCTLDHAPDFSSFDLLEASLVPSMRPYRLL